MTTENTIDSETGLLDLMSRLCHAIAFETASESDPGDDNDNKVGNLDKKEIISKLYAMTEKGMVPERISSLAESFGLMMVKLDVRKMQQKQLISELQKKNTALETARKKLNDQNKSLVVSLREKYSPSQYVGQCRQMEAAKKMALSIAMRPINTLILGSSGTGKEVFAKIIHFNSPRADKVFIAVNCTAIPDSLFESEMFGIEKGVATGVTKRTGYFEKAHTGSIFLDEIGDMSLANQAKLLRVLEEGEVRRVGGGIPIKVDVKIISATNLNLKEAVERGTFREDLYYRLNVVELLLPLLKDRGGDIIILAEKLLSKNCHDLGRPPLSLSDNARQLLLAYEWPGNVRELNNEMERAAALTLSDRVGRQDLSEKLKMLAPDTTDKVQTHSPDQFSLDDGHILNLAEIEKQVVHNALEKTRGNKTKAAQLMGITREGLRKKLIRLSK